MTKILNDFIRIFSQDYINKLNFALESFDKKSTKKDTHSLEEEDDIIDEFSSVGAVSGYVAPLKLEPMNKKTNKKMLGTTAK